MRNKKIKEQLIEKIERINKTKKELDEIKEIFEKKDTGIPLYLMIFLVILIIMAVFLTISFIVLVMENGVIIHKTTQVINEIPEYSADCVRVEEIVNGTSTGDYTLQCKRVNQS